MRQSDSNLKSCLVFFCSFFSFFFCCERRDFFLLLKMYKPQNSCRHTRSQRKRGKREASKHFNTFVAFPGRHFDFIVWHFRLLRILFNALCAVWVICCWVGWDDGSLAFISYQSRNHWNGNLLSFANAPFTFYVSQFEACLCEKALPCTCRFIFMTNIAVYFILNVLIFQVVNVS